MCDFIAKSVPERSLPHSMARRALFSSVRSSVRPMGRRDTWGGFGCGGAEVLEKAERGVTLGEVRYAPRPFMAE